MIKNIQFSVFLAKKTRFSGLKNGRIFFFQTFFSEKLEMAYIYQKNKKSWKKNFLLQLPRFFDPKNEHLEMTICPKSHLKC